MKRFKKVFIITLLMLPFIINISNAETGKVNTGTVRVREKASTNSEIVTNAYKGDEVEIIETEGEWYKVKVDGKTGYIKSDFIESKKESNNNSNTSTETNESTNNETSSKLAINKNTKIKAFPSMASTSLGTIEAGKSVSKISEINNWYKVTDGTVTGWVLSNRIGGEIQKSEEDKKEEENKDTEKKSDETETKKEEKKDSDEKTTSSINKTAIIKVKTARVRSSKSTSEDNIVDLLDYNDEVTVIEQEGSWYKIKYGNNKEGYIDSGLVTMKDSQGVTSRSLGEERQAESAQEAVAEEPANTQPESTAEPANITPPASGSGQAVVDFAMQFLGYPYVSAGKRPETGFDCSGFTSYVFSNFGVSLGGSAASQVSAGVEVDRSSLATGDLLLFYNDGKSKIGHAGIYISGGDFIHAANPSRGVVIDNINTSSYYNERYVTARRLVQ